MGSVGDGWLIALDAGLGEALLFAGVLFLVGGLDDLAIDLAWARMRRPPARFEDLPPAPPCRLAVFVPAWDEGAVIAAMLRATLSRYRHDDYRLFVGCYPNDPATIAAVATVAQEDARVRLVIGEADGPTTKAANLNDLWRALRRADARDGRATDAVVLHDAEDVVDPFELALVERLLPRFALVQLPVVPLLDRGATLVAGTYADEFAESHGRTLVVRGALGVALPLAGVGCALRCDALAAIAGAGDAPFDPRTLTEDYELGLRLGALGLPACFARVTAPGRGAPIATRAYFPDRVRPAVVQKARWMVGIAFAGWDRTGWGAGWRPAEWWMRLRDRRAPLAVIALAVAYAALAGSALSWAAHAWRGTAMPWPQGALRWLLAINALLLAWRLAMRAGATARVYGWREGMRAVPRAVVGNIVAMLAARRALVRYCRMLAGDEARWDKTAHRFPATVPGDA
ncbi:glycosyl transferase family protein [Sphingomonas corticis]|jgi:adsorption protein B|uniref:Glycosyl transferase family protein n=1 Tax=Sphingomonas corticis TaxID=2722791 RepID=A0ABX1CP76_9SPHN|nr:glycosyl transferase family protein [Sphingomonas corticis]NJR79699.1 glycosyl transferase family protein [Sphingomonas corticis]